MMYISCLYFLLQRMNADVGVFHAEDKGHGLKAKSDLKP